MKKRAIISERFTPDLEFLGKHLTCHFDLSALHLSSTAHELLCMDSIWCQRMCYVHHFSGDWLMPWWHYLFKRFSLLQEALLPNLWIGN